TPRGESRPTSETVAGCGGPRPPAKFWGNPPPDKPTLPGAAKARAIIRRTAAEAENYLAPPITELFRMALYRDEPASQTEIAEAQGKVMEELATLETRLTGPYLAGPLSLADFTAVPYVRLLKRFNEREPGRGTRS